MMRSITARSSGSWPIARGFRSFGCTSRSVRATFMSPQQHQLPPGREHLLRVRVHAPRNVILAGKSLPPFGT